jgi:hypothetical protein
MRRRGGKAYHTTLQVDMAFDFLPPLSIPPTTPWGFPPPNSSQQELLSKKHRPPPSSMREIKDIKRVIHHQAKPKRGDLMGERDTSEQPDGFEIRRE